MRKMYINWMLRRSWGFRLQNSSSLQYSTLTVGTVIRRSSSMLPQYSDHRLQTDISTYTHTYIRLSNQDHKPTPHLTKMYITILPLLLSLSVFTTSAHALLPVLTPTVYLIRHGEKPTNGTNGLSTLGLQRSQCVKNTFSTSSPYNIGYILAETPKSDGKRARPYLTVAPLAQSLGIKVDTSCDRDDAECLRDAVQKYRTGGGKKNVLICWEHGQLSDIVKALGGTNEGTNVPEYPGDRFDLIWTDRFNYAAGVSGQKSQCCPGLDQC